ncbi:MAG: hypothetical protein ACPHQP_08540 [Longimicrobiales bacterium]
MSPRKTILRELDHAGTYTRPATISGFSTAPDKYQRAVNAPLKDRLLEGRTDDEGHMTITIKERRRADVRRELRPIWAHPAVLATLVLIAAVGAGLAI